jgi:hypothetical protein
MRTSLERPESQRPESQRPEESGSPHAKAQASPWWRHPMVWLVISGPAAVVVAGFWTLWLAIGHPDPVVTATPVQASVGGDAHTLAMQARNHAATSRTRP